MDPLRALLDANATLRARAAQTAPPVARTTWDRVVGPRIAARSEPYRLERGVLLVRVASSAWANELSLLSEPIVEQLRAQGIEVTSVRFIVGEVALSPRRTRGPAAVVPPRDAPVPAPLRAVLDRVPSPALREALAQAAAKSMALAQAAAERFGRRRPAATTREPPVRVPSDPTPKPVATARWVDRARESVLPPPPEAAAERYRAAEAPRRTNTDAHSGQGADEAEEPDE